MGGKRGACRLLPATLVIMAAVTIAGCCGGLNSLMPQDIARGGNNVSLPGQDVGRSTNSTVPLAQVTPVPTVIPAPAPTSRPAAFTFYAEGGKDHCPGETIRLYGMDTCSDAVYLFISCTKTPISGGRLKDLLKPVIDRDNTTFTRVNVSKDGSWNISGIYLAASLHCCSIYTKL
jgi:hypothetical protein